MADTLATYAFDYKITSDLHRCALSGPLFTQGKKVTGTATFYFQSVDEGTPIVPRVDASYVTQPFSVDIDVNGKSVRHIDSTISSGNGRRGIIVQDVTGATYYTVLFEGFSGPVALDDTFVNPATRSLHTQLGLFALSITISNDELNGASECNI